MDGLEFVAEVGAAVRAPPFRDPDPLLGRNQLTLLLVGERFHDGGLR
ncbi:MAG TPA: hypothetical protein VNF75_06945 [Candidatus Dormibacteraeota bacterium]|nr:hypothetical protein [Candidatus Dormibacteraeota bacterium]